MTCSSRGTEPEVTAGRLGFHHQVSKQVYDLFLVRNLLVTHWCPGAAADHREEHVAGEGLLDPCHVQPAQTYVVHNKRGSSDGLTSVLPGLRIRIGSGFNRFSGSGSGSRRAKITHISRKNILKFMFWSVGWPLLRAEGFFCNLDVLYGGLGIQL